MKFDRLFAFFPHQRHLRSAIALIVISLTWLGSVNLGAAQQPSLPSSTTRDIWKQVYQKLPNLPQENKYISRETGKVNPNSTLVDRLIRYHLYVKGRTPNYRLDWKLTLADYLGANEIIQENVYPGADVLQQNPLDGDRAAIARLNRKQRDALVQTLVSIFQPNSTSTAGETKAPPQPTTTPSSETQPLFPQPKPGDAQLLQP